MHNARSIQGFFTSVLAKSPFLYIFLLFFACQSPKQAQIEEIERTQSPKSIQDAVVNYLALSNFVNPNFAEQALGNHVEFLRYDRRGQILYFTTVRNPFKPEFIQEICLDTSQVEYGKIENRRMRLAPISIRDTNLQLFRFHKNFLKVDSTRVISREIEGKTFKMDMFELRDFYGNNALYNSPALVETSISPKGIQRVIANHSAPIARKGSTPLLALIEQISDTTRSKERIAQDLLNFVSRDIAYEDHGSYEIFMKPHEVLLSGESDCSGKVVLYSSLLNQMEIPHLLTYMKGHIAVAVKGDFERKNGMFFSHEGSDYFIAETTLPGFYIGRSTFRPAITWENIQYLQRPGNETKLYDIHNEDSLEFVLGEIISK